MRWSSILPGVRWPNFCRFRRRRKLVAKVDRVNGTQQRRESRAADIGKRLKNKVAKKRPKRWGCEAPRPCKFACPGHQRPTRLTKPRTLQSFRVDRDRKTVKFPTFERPGRVLKSGCGASADAPQFAPTLREPARCPPSGGLSLGRSRQPIADYRFCTAGGNEDDVAGFHLGQHCLAARLGRTVTHANIFAEFARRDHNCRPALSGSASQLHQQFVPEMVDGNQLPTPLNQIIDQTPPYRTEPMLRLAIRSAESPYAPR
jgi:hypothetical protein